MSGGLIEGIKKCYVGNNVFTKHMFILILSVLVALPSSIAAINTPGGNADTYSYMFLSFPLLGIISTITSIVLGYYTLQFTRNALKFFNWKEKQTDETKINSLQIMPEINAALFGKMPQWIAFGIIYGLYFVILFLILGIGVAFPQTKLISILVLTILACVICISFPYILCGFVKDFDIKKHINPLLIFIYLPKVILPALILIFKVIGLTMLFSLGIIILVFICAVIFSIAATLAGIGAESLVNNTLFVTLITTLYVYGSLILGFGYYYVVANIYHEQIEKCLEDQLPANKEI